MTRLAVLQGGAEARPVLHPTAALARRAGITPVAVPEGMFVSPRLVAAMKAPRHLRSVA